MKITSSVRRRLQFRDESRSRSFQRVIAIETGEADLAYAVSANDSKRVEEDDNLQLFKASSQSVSYLTVNGENKLFSDKRVRQAIRYAVDKEAIVETMLYGAGEPADSVIPPNAFGFSKKLFLMNIIWKSEEADERSRLS